MDQDTVIKVENVSKKFSRSLKRSMAYGTIDMTRSFLGIAHDQGHLRKGEFWSLENINFEVKKGETFGLVGSNGSGKSTLLRLINGIFPPDAGKISVMGRIGALIAVGAGFHPHMTGRENIYLNGVILGMTRKEIEARFNDIVEFAEIGSFLEAPVSTYSSGMTVRLGFAIAIHSNPDIMMVDEILAVGDGQFQRKCQERIKEMRSNGVTFLLVTHNMDTIYGMCNRAALINKGVQISVGSPEEIVPEYELLLRKNSISPIKYPAQDPEKLVLVKKYSDYGTDEITIESLLLKNNLGLISKEFDSKEQMFIEVSISSPREFTNMIFRTAFIYMNNYEDGEGNISSMGVENMINISKGKSKIIFKLEKLQLSTGEYKLSIKITDDTNTNPYIHGHYGYFTVKKDKPTNLKVGEGTPVYWSEATVKTIID